MHIIALGQQKGGVGKSSAAINLACQAAASGSKAAILDLDAEQGTADKWGKRRTTDAPAVRAGDAATLSALLTELRAAGMEWVFLDLPGRNAPVSGAGIGAAELVIVPARPLDVDIEASVPTVQAAKRAGKPYAYLINIVPAQISKTRAATVSGDLAKMGHKVCPVMIIQRVQVADAVAAGKGANEIKDGALSSAEFAALFAWIKKEVRK